MQRVSRSSGSGDCDGSSQGSSSGSSAGASPVSGPAVKKWSRASAEDDESVASFSVLTAAVLMEFQTLGLRITDEETVDDSASGEADLNRRVRITAPNGTVVSCIVCPFDDKVHYAPPIPLEEMSPEDLAESDLVFSTEFAELSFVCRVLCEAMDPSVPLLDRFKFICIVSFNLDEHFSKRLGYMPKLDPRDFETASLNLRRQVRPQTRYEEELTTALRAIFERQHRCLNEEILPKLAAHSVEIVDHKKLTSIQAERMTVYFKERLRPGLTPFVLDQTHPFPCVQSYVMYMCLNILNPNTNVQHNMIVRIPEGKRLIPIDDKETRFITVEDVCLANIGLVCHGMIVLRADAFRVTRNTKMTIEDSAFGEMNNMLDFVIDEVHRRRSAPATRLEVLTTMPESVITLLKHELCLDDTDVYVLDGPVLDLSSCISMAFVELPWLRHTIRDPVVPGPFKGLSDRLRTDPGAIFGVIRHRDVLAEYPVHNFENSIILFLHAAGRDPCVRTIKAVLYRCGSDSPIVAALIRAAKNGKEVSVLIELKASFDEVQNAEYARALQLAGCNVTYGIIGLKVHSKIMLVVREEPDGKLLSYINVSTGNFNAKTAKLYTDMSLYTCRVDASTDVLDIFNILTGYSAKTDFRTLLVAPVNMLERFVDLIRDEAANARLRKPSRIVCQVNGLSDKTLVKELYEASQAGVNIDLLVRGSCRLRPGIPGKSDNIRVFSWVGQVLQHRRVFYFEAGGPGKYFIGSADWRARNLNDRVEVVVPIEDPSIRKRLAKSFNIINDTKQIWRMASDGRYYKGMPAGLMPVELPSAKKHGSKRHSETTTGLGYLAREPETVSTDANGIGRRGRVARSPHETLMDSMGEDKADIGVTTQLSSSLPSTLPSALPNALTGTLPASVAEAPVAISGQPKRSRAQRRYQVNIKGNQTVVDKIAVGAVPIRFTGVEGDLQGLEVLMVARGGDSGDPWSVPKGGKNEGETDQQATVRIAREKVGVSSCVEIANLGWVLRRKRTKTTAVQTFVLLVRELGNFVNSRHDRKREWMPYKDALAHAKESGSEFSENALRRAYDACRAKYAAPSESGTSGITGRALSVTTVQSSSVSAPPSPPSSNVMTVRIANGSQPVDIPDIDHSDKSDGV